MGAPRCGAWRHSTLGETRRIRRNVSNCVELEPLGRRPFSGAQLSLSMHTVTWREAVEGGFELVCIVFSGGYEEGNRCECQTAMKTYGRMEVYECISRRSPDARRLQRSAPDDARPLGGVEGAITGPARRDSWRGRRPIRWDGAERRLFADRP